MQLLTDAGFPSGKGLPTITLEVESQENADLLKPMTDAWEKSIGLSSNVVVFSGQDYIAELNVE